MIQKVLLKSLLVNVFLTILKIIGSIISGSVTLLADAIHCMSDMLTDFISLIGAKISNKKPDEKHPFGHGKVEYLTSIVMSILICFLAISTLVTSIKGEVRETNLYACIVLVLSIILKIILSRYLLRKGKELNSSIIVSNGTETKYDTYSSFLALIFILVSLVGTKNKMFLYADVLGGIVLSLLTFKAGIELLLTNISSILGEIDTDEEKINIVNNIVLKNKIITKIRRTTLLKNGTYYSVTLELNVDGNYTLNELYQVEKKIKSDLKKTNLNIRYVTVNFKPNKNHVTSK